MIAGLLVGLILTFSLAQAQICGVDVYNLHVEANRITAYIRNTGSSTQEIVWYLWIDNSIRYWDKMRLAPGQSQAITRTWSFGTGEHSVLFEAESACGADDNEQAIHIVLPMPEPWTPEGPTPLCSLAITTFDYTSITRAGDQAYARTEISNTASSTTINISLWIDGVLNQSQSVWIETGQTETRTFYFSPSQGNHTLNITIRAACGASYAVNGSMFVQPITNITIEQPRPEQSTIQTTITVIPTYLEMTVNRTESIAINIRSGLRQNFTLNVSGVPQEWLKYERVKSVQGLDTMYVDIEPAEQGSYKLLLTVRAEAENKTFTFAVDVYAGLRPVPSEMWQKLREDIQALIKFYQENPFWLAVTIAVVFVAVLVTGAIKLREEGIGI